MALYLGSSEKLQINSNNIAYYLNLYSDAPITNGIRLLSSDGNILRDSNLLYVTTTIPIYLLDSDGLSLIDFNGAYLTIKENE